MVDNYKVIFDYHTHTLYSDGKGTIEGIVEAAIQAGLEEIGISDHGYGHIFYGVKRKKRKAISDEIKRLRLKYPNIKIRDNIEANILGPSGKIDLEDSDYDDFDFILCGYHYGSAVKSFSDFYMHFMNWIYKITNRFKNKASSINTKAIINTIKNNKIDILVHPGDKGPVDILQIAKECEKRNIIMEINERHSYLNTEQLSTIKDMDLKFIISSDSHCSAHVGEYSNSIQRVIDSGVDEKKVINLRRI